MKKVLVVLLFLMAIGFGIATFYFYKESKTAKTEVSSLNQQLTALKLSVAQTVTTREVCVVRKDVTGGDMVRDTDIEYVEIPIELVTEKHITNPETIIGKYFKIDLAKGTTVTSDLLVEFETEGTTYVRDITFPYLPLGLSVGDFVDIRMSLPYGEEFIILSHKRVQQLVQESSTIQVIMNDAELALWSSALTDKALYGSQGLSIYVTKYTDPGYHDPAVQYYPVREEVAVTVKINPAIPDKNVCVNSKLRQVIDTLLTAVPNEDATKLRAGKTEEASAINSSINGYDAENDIKRDEGVNDTLSDISGELGDIGKDILGNYGNLESTITDNQKEDAKGDDVFKDEEPIE